MNEIRMNQTLKVIEGIFCVCVFLFVCLFFVFPVTALEKRHFIASLLVLLKRFSWFFIKMLNFQNVFVYKWWTKSEGVYRVIHTPAVLHHVIHFSKWKLKFLFWGVNCADSLCIKYLTYFLYSYPNLNVRPSTKIIPIFNF